MSKIAVIGAGQVGATTAYTLAVSGLAEEIAVVDLNEALARGVAADVAHGMPFCAPVRLCAGDYGAAEGADVVIMTDEPSKLADAVRISRYTLRIVKQNIAFALGVKLLVMLLGAFGVATMWEAVFADVGVSLIAVLNAIRALKYRPR